MCGVESGCGTARSKREHHADRTPVRRGRDSFGGNMTKRLTAVIHREGDGFVALCPELDIASQGDTIEVARGGNGDIVDI